MTPLPRALVVQHEDTCPVGLIEPWLRRVGLDCDVLPAHRGRALPAALVDHVALVVLGGQMGADDEADQRWLLPTKALVAATVADGLPFLGVCLGHQLATVALGGRVAPNPLGSTRALKTRVRSFLWPQRGVAFWRDLPDRLSDLTRRRGS